MKTMYDLKKIANTLNDYNYEVDLTRWTYNTGETIDESNDDENVDQKLTVKNIDKYDDIVITAKKNNISLIVRNSMSYISEDGTNIMTSPLFKIYIKKTVSSFSELEDAYYRGYSIMDNRNNVINIMTADWNDCTQEYETFVWLDTENDTDILSFGKDDLESGKLSAVKLLMKNGQPLDEFYYLMIQNVDPSESVDEVLSFIDSFYLLQ